MHVVPIVFFSLVNGLANLSNIKSLGRINNYTESGKNNRGKFIEGNDNFRKLLNLVVFLRNIV